MKKKIFKLKTARGQHMKVVLLNNRAAVKGWVESNPGGSMTDCRDELKLSYATIRGHLKALREEA